LHVSAREGCKLKVVILGPDGAGKTSVIQRLKEILVQAGRVVQIRHLKPRIFVLRRGEPVTIVVDPHGKPNRSALFSLAKIFVWFFEEWYANLFWDDKSAMIICDRYYHDLLIDSRRYRYGGPRWAANLVGKLIPMPDLWVLLDAPVEVLQARKQEVTAMECARQRQAYLSFVQNQRNHVIVDASQSLAKVIRDVELAILEANASKGHHG
jgi:thymidylate kinase